MSFAPHDKICPPPRVLFAARQSIIKQATLFVWRQTDGRLRSFYAK